MDTTARQLPSNTDVPPSSVKNIVNDARLMPAGAALRLSLFFSMDAQFFAELAN